MRRKLRPHRRANPKPPDNSPPLLDLVCPPLRCQLQFLAQQLPPLTKFSGEYQETEGETFRDWREQFEMVAAICRWDDQAKLVNLVTQLRGQAYAFSRSCTAQQRASYQALVAEVTKRFTPVWLQAVQSSLFHERKQKPKELVDDYAQELWRLFHKAYPSAQQGSAETESMGKLVLAYQFVAGLHSDLKMKVAGTEGSFDELLAKAQLHEAQLRDLAGETQKAIQKKPYESGNVHTRQPRGNEIPDGDRSKGKQSGSIWCFSCGSTGHIAQQCRWHGSRSSEEGVRTDHPQIARLSQFL